jgi:hypothetical protein
MVNVLNSMKKILKQLKMQFKKHFAGMQGAFLERNPNEKNMSKMQKRI